MYYVNFDSMITATFKIVLEKWPINKFHAPSEMTKLELTTVSNHFSTGITRFRLLSDEEFREWQTSRQSNQHATSTSNAVPISNDMDVDDPAHEGRGAIALTDEGRGAIALTDEGRGAFVLTDQSNTADYRPAMSAVTNSSTALPATVINFGSGVTDAYGNTMFIPYKPRKERSDKGKRKSGSTSVAENIAPV